MGKGRAKANGKLEERELKKGPWTREEDQMLLAYIEQHGHGSWRALPPKAGLQRCGKSCRLRWTNYLRPDIKRGKFSSHEEKAIIRLHALLGNRWSAIATHLPKRTDNEIKNYWNTRLKKRLIRMGIDPVTHKPKTGSGSAEAAAMVNHMAQWETARLEAEARLARESRLLASRLQPPIHKISVPPPAAAAAVTPCLGVLKIWQGCSSSSTNFFGCLDSPTSTLTFSGPPAGSSRMANGGGGRVVLVNSPNAEWGEKSNPEMENLGDLIHREPFAAVDYGCNPMVMNCNEYNNTVTATATVTVTTDFEENKNYWNELLSMVSTPMQSSGF